MQRAARAEKPAHFVVAFDARVWKRVVTPTACRALRCDGRTVPCRAPSGLRVSRLVLAAPRSNSARTPPFCPPPARFVTAMAPLDAVSRAHGARSGESVQALDAVPRASCPSWTFDSSPRQQRTTLPVESGSISSPPMSATLPARGIGGSASRSPRQAQESHTAAARARWPSFGGGATSLSRHRRVGGAVQPGFPAPRWAAVAVLVLVSARVHAQSPSATPGYCTTTYAAGAMNGPQAVGVGLSDTIYVAQPRVGNGVLYPSLTISDSWGNTGSTQWAGDYGLATSAFVGTVRGVTGDSSTGDIYLADSTRIRWIFPNGTIRECLAQMHLGARSQQHGGPHARRPRRYARRQRHGRIDRRRRRR